MKELILERLLSTSLSLSSEKNGDNLLEHILTSAMDICRCDAGTLYIRNGDRLDFKIMITKSLNIYQGGRFSEITLPSVSLTPYNVCARSLIEGNIINIEDLTQNTGSTYAGPKVYDAMLGYQSKSMLVAPLEDNNGEKIGVLQLMNALDYKGNIIPFSKDIEVYISALASQAAVSVVNLQHKNEIRLLLESLVGALSTAIYIRTPYNVTHTQNMVRYSENFIEWLNKSNSSWKFDDDKKREFIMSVWLHDVGKLTVPLEVMNKKDRLGTSYEKIMARFDLITCLSMLQDKNNETFNSDNIKKQVEHAKNLIDYINTVSFLDDKHEEEIRQLAKNTYIDLNGQTKKWVEDSELLCLTIKKGTLTYEERLEMETHVEMTDKILENVNFGSDYRNVHKWATRHHEFVNGEGYHNKLTFETLDKESMLLTIIDVFDGLSAKDRPYKQAIPLDKVIEILKAMVKEKKLNGEILNLFLESKAWEDNEG